MVNFVFKRELTTGTRFSLLAEASTTRITYSAAVGTLGYLHVFLRSRSFKLDYISPRPSSLHIHKARD
jgi:hypothetical protein